MKQQTIIYKTRPHPVYTLPDGRRYIVAAPGRMYLDAAGVPQPPQALARRATA